MWGYWGWGYRVGGTTESLTEELEPEGDVGVGLDE